MVDMITRYIPIRNDHIFHTKNEPTRTVIILHGNQPNIEALYIKYLNQLAWIDCRAWVVTRSNGKRPNLEINMTKMIMINETIIETRAR